MTYLLQTGNKRKVMSEIRELSRRMKDVCPAQIPISDPVPSFVCERSFTFGTPIGEVKLRRFNRCEHVREPAQEPHVHFSQNQSFQGRNKETDDLRAQTASMQVSLFVITARLENQNVTPETFNVPYGSPPIRSASVPSHFPNRMQTNQDRNEENDRSTVPFGRERSLSPHHYVSDNYPNFPMASSAPVSVNYHNRSREPYIKVAVYDGKTSWKDNLVQFELAAQENQWNEHTRAIRLDLV